MDDELPGYFDDDQPVPGAAPAGAPPVVSTLLVAPPPAPPAPRPASTLIPLAVAAHPPTATTVVVQVVPVRPDIAARVVSAWTSPLRAGRDRLTVRGTTSGGACACASHVRVDVRGRARPPLAIEVGCAPWSSGRAELHVVPARAVRGDRRRYYRAAHALLDALVRELRCADRPVPSGGHVAARPAVGARPRSGR